MSARQRQIATLFEWGFVKRRQFDSAVRPKIPRQYFQVGSACYYTRESEFQSWPTAFYLLLSLRSLCVLAGMVVRWLKNSSVPLLDRREE